MPVFSRTARSFGAPSVLPMPDYNALVFKRPFLAVRAGLPVNVRSRSGQPCSLCRAGDLCVLRPARRIHIRLRGRVLHNSPPPASVRSALAPTVTALGTLGSSARCSGSRPPSRSLRRRSRRLRGDTRRNASSAGYRLLALRRVSPRIRRTASLHVAQFGTRPLVPCLTFHKVHFSFAASALADVPSARLILPVADVSRFRPHRNLISPRLISARKFRYNMPNAVENEESERKHQNGR